MERVKEEGEGNLQGRRPILGVGRGREAALCPSLPSPSRSALSSPCTELLAAQP